MVGTYNSRKVFQCATKFGSIPVFALATTTTTSAVIKEGSSILAAGSPSTVLISSFPGDIPKTNRALIRSAMIYKPTMVIMLQRSLRDPVAKIIAPLVKTLIKMRVSANQISAIGGLGSVVSALYFFSNGRFFIGVIWVSVFVAFDLFDGAVARASNKGISKWGALLDSTLDRLSDGAIFIGALIYFIDQNDPLVPVLLVATFASFMVSYIKARAESLLIKCEGGLAERGERVIIILTAYGLHGLGVNYAMAVGIWLLALISVFTMIQRMMIVYKAVK